MAEPAVPLIELAPGYRISRLIKGGWQLAGGHGAVDRQRAMAAMAEHVEAGIVTFDCADIYTGVEELIGAFRREYLQRHGAGALAGCRVHTKFVPDLDILPRIDKAHVGRIIDRSLARLAVDRIDLVQLHWWDMGMGGCVETAFWLDELRRAGKIDRLGLTNFASAGTAALLDAGLPLVSNQVQYSLLDRRPETAMAGLGAARGLGLLAYGTLAGGFFADRWLDAAEPVDLAHNRSLVKYKLIIDEFGGWALFQELLAVLAGIARRHGCGMGTVATRWVLDRPGVKAAIVGARYARHLRENIGVFGVELEPRDLALIDDVLERARGPSGEVYALERNRDGPHGRIMRYDLNG